jgi:hypothetical protein
MPNRAERRAAERAALKAFRNNPTQNPTVASTNAQPVAAEISETIIPPASDFTRTASEAQINANRQNAQKSTGPVSDTGKAASSQNRRTHGLLGHHFTMLTDENPFDYEDLIDSITTEFKPQTDDDYRLALAMAQHYWLSQRALRLQDKAMLAEDDKKTALFMRYHAQHERSFLKFRKELKASMKEREKNQNGFESQKAKNEALEARARLQNARAQDLEIDTLCKKAIDLPPLPDHSRIGFEQIAKACAKAIAVLAMEERQNAGEFAEAVAA